MITLAVTVNNETRIYPVTTIAVEVTDGCGWHNVNSPWLSDDDSTECNNFSGIDAENVSYLYTDGYDNITSCDFDDARYELRIDGVHDHDAIVNFFKGGFDASVSE
jgi:hypothetical protein